MLHSKFTAGFFIVALAFAATPDTRLADASKRDDIEAIRQLLRSKASVAAAAGDGMTALHWTVYRGDVKATELILSARPNLDAGTRINAITPLLLASRSGQVALVEALLRAGADPNRADGNGTTPLMIAAASGDQASVAALIQHGAHVNAREAAHGQTALMFAAALNRAAAVKTLLDSRADATITTRVIQLERPRFDKTGNLIPPGSKIPEEDPEDEATDEPKEQLATAKAGDGDRPVTVAAVDHAVGGPPVGSTKETETKPAVDGKSKTVDAKKKRIFGATAIGGMTALLFSAREGHLDAARALLTGGADVNQVSGSEKTSPLVMAILNGHYDLAKLLLASGADPNLATVQGLTALYATLDVQWAPHGWSPEPITDQEKTSYLELMRELLKRGANPNARLAMKVWSRTLSQDGTWVDAAGATPFWRAAQATDLEAMKLLVRGGANPSLPTTAGVTPLMVASGLGWAANFSVNSPEPWLPVVQYCLEHGSDVNAADKKGYTALHGSAFIGNDELVTFLLQMGARANLKTKGGDSAADMANGPMAHSIPHPATVALLEQYGSSNSHKCRSDQCVVAPKEDKKPVVVAAARKLP